MVLYDSSWQDCPNTGRITGAYIVFYQGVSIDHYTYVPGTVAQSSAEIQYNSAWTAVMDLLHIRILNNKLLSTDTYVVPEQATLIILDRKYYIRVDKIGKNTKHTRHISRIISLVRNGEDWNLYKKILFGGVLQLS